MSLAIALRTHAAMSAKPIKPKKPRKPKWPHKPRAEYYRDLLGIVEKMQAVVQRDLLPLLGLIVAQVNVTRPEDAPIRHDAPGDDIEGVIATVTATVNADVDDAEIEMLAQKNVVRTTTWHGNEFQKQIRDVVPINVYDDTTGLLPHLEVAIAENVRLIKGLKDKTLDELKGVVLRGARAGVHQSVIAEQIQQQFGMSKKRAALIATDQVGKLNGELNQIRQQRLGVRRYRWSSSQDERVRKRHRQLNGTVQEWAKPPVTDERTGERAHPGQPIRCRCQPIPIIDDIFADAGLIDPSEVETQRPQGKKRPLGPVDVPPKPPANEPLPRKRGANTGTPHVVGTAEVRMSPLSLPSSSTTNETPKKRASAAQPPALSPVALPPAPAPKPAAVAPPKPKKAKVPKTPAGPPSGGGGGGGSGGGGSGGGSGRGNQKAIRALREGMETFAKSKTKGGAAVRGASRDLLGEYKFKSQNETWSKRNVMRVVAQLDELRVLAEMQLWDGQMNIAPTSVAKLTAGLRKLAAGEAASMQELDAITTIIHEEIHGMGAAIGFGLDNQTAIFVEEVATEVSARRIARDVVGTELSELADNHVHNLPRIVAGEWSANQVPYDDIISVAMAELHAATGWEEAQVRSALEEAALAFKRRSGTLRTHAEFANGFAAGVPGLTEDEGVDFASRLLNRGSQMNFRLERRKP